MADNKIVKAFEVLDSWQQVALHNDDGTDEESPKLYKAIKTVKEEYNRQKAEIERLNNKFTNLMSKLKQLTEADFGTHPQIDPNDFCGVPCDFMENLVDKAKAEAIKEFAMRFEDELGEYYMSKHLYVGTVLDNLVKEMVGDVG